MIGVELRSRRPITPQIRKAVQLAISTEVTSPGDAVYIMPSEAVIVYESVRRSLGVDFRIRINSTNIQVIQVLEKIDRRGILRDLRYRLPRGRQVSLTISRPTLRY